jgi:branched-chain amino acid transport system permease protein
MISLSDIDRHGGARVLLPMGLLALAALTAPVWLTAVGLYQYLGIEIAIWMIYALGFNLLFGYSGLHAFGHGAYLGLGAYAFGLFQQHMAVSLPGGLLAAIIVAGLAGALVGAIISHRRGIYYSLLTIACGQVLWFAAVKIHWITRGEDGLLNIPRPSLNLGFVSFDLNNNVVLYYVVATALLLTVLVLWRLANSPFGRVLQAIRQNEVRAAFVGYDVWRFKWAAFVISAMFAGLAGGLSRRHEPPPVRPDRHDGAGGRRAGEFLGTGAGRHPVLHRPRRSGCDDWHLAPVVRADVHRHGDVPS